MHLLYVSGTHFTTVKNNVAFNVRGHTFFIEDGGERYNTFENNLAAMTLCSEVRLPLFRLVCVLNYNYFCRVH